MPGLTQASITRLRAMLKAFERGLPANPAQGADRSGRPARGTVPPEKRWYRIVTNDTGGAYTLIRQQHNQTTGLLEDLSDIYDPDWNPLASPPAPRQIAAHDCQGAATGVADQKVQGWRVWVNGIWLTLIDLLGAGGAPHKMLDGQVQHADVVGVEKDAAPRNSLMMAGAAQPWDDTETYVIGATVTHAGGDWASLKDDNTNHTPVEGKAWSATTTYAANDTASHGGTGWKSLQAGNLNHTPVEGAWWTADANVGWWTEVDLGAAAWDRMDGSSTPCQGPFIGADGIRGDDYVRLHP